MKTPERRFFEERLEIKPDGVHDGLEELGLLVAILGSLIILASIGLVVYVKYLLG